MKKHIFIVEKTATGFSAYAKEDSLNVGTTGKTLDELKANLLEAFNLLNERLGKPTVKSEDIVLEIPTEENK